MNEMEELVKESFDDWWEQIGCKGDKSILWLAYLNGWSDGLQYSAESIKELKNDVSRQR